MPEPRILPLGFIDRTTDDGAIIMLTRPSDSHTLQPGTPVTLLTRSAGEQPASARVRGLITSVGYITAAFRVLEKRTRGNWPEGELFLRRGTPVYQALADSFKRDPQRNLSKEEAESLRSLAARYEEITNPRRSTAGRPPKPPRNGASPDR